MYNKTTNFIFQKYGEVFKSSSMPKKPNKLSGRETKKISNKNFDGLYCSQEDIYIKVLQGDVLLVVTDDIQQEDLNSFVIHRVTKINAGVYFNFISITDKSKLEIFPPINIKHTQHKLTTPFVYKPIVPKVKIQEILACYYSVRNPNYKFTGEVHNHWELTMVDNGQLKTDIIDKSFTLENYQMLLYSPGQFHNQYTTADHSCSYLTIMFDMECTEAEKLQNKIFDGNKNITNAINNFVRFSDANSTYSNDLMICHLQEIIIRLLYNDLIEEKPIVSTPMQQKFENELLNELIIYINDNIYKRLTIEELCQEFYLSRSTLQQLFKNNLATAPKQYINDLKLHKSQLLIKESKYTISEISNLLGFSSIHYFSRKFKQQFGITPTDYAKTIYK
ncbi:MAG: helix-turn-helix transcriptional regulator [Erysipelotrichaceae bacterium]